MKFGHHDKDKVPHGLDHCAILGCIPLHFVFRVMVELAV